MARACGAARRRGRGASCVTRAVDRTLAGQRPDGSWPYGEAPNLGWVDSFHTGYVLSCLVRLRDVDPRIDEAVARGAQYYERFFDAQGRAPLWPDKPFPEDAHSAGTGLTTLALLVRAGIVPRELLERVARPHAGCGHPRRPRGLAALPLGPHARALHALVRRPRRARARRRRGGAARAAGPAGASCAPAAPGRASDRLRRAAARGAQAACDARARARARRASAAPGACGSTGDPRRRAAGCAARCRRAAAGPR